MPSISFIIPCYNVEKWLDRCLESIEHQTIGIENLEIICVDDCSKDSTVDKLLQWEKKYPDNFVIIPLEENRRQGNARNIGMQYASGEWIAFVDSDDWIEPDYCECMLNASTGNDYEIICSGYGRDFSKELTGFDNNYSSERREIFIANDEERKPYIINPPLNYSAWAKLIRKDFLVENQLFFPTDITYEDAAWGSLVHLYVSKACLLEKKLYHYFVNEESTVLTTNSNHHLDCITAQTIVWREYKQRGFYDVFRYELEMEHIYSAFLPAIKMSIYRYQMPDYNVYLLVRELMMDRIADYKENPYVKAGRLSEFHRLILTSLDVVLSKQQYYELADNIKKIGL